MSIIWYMFHQVPVSATHRTLMIHLFGRLKVGVILVQQGMLPHHSRSWLNLWPKHGKGKTMEVQTYGNPM